MIFDPRTLLLQDDRCSYHPTRIDPARQFPLREPTDIIVHYDVCHSIDMNTRAVFASGLDYHLALDGWHTGKHAHVEIRQYLPLNLRGAHAKGFNEQSVAVTVVNPGPLVVGTDGIFRTTYGREWPANDVVEATWPGTPWKFWAKYSDEERETLGQLCGAIATVLPSIRRIRPHSDVTPGKVDPGPALNLHPVRRLASVFCGRELLAA